MNRKNVILYIAGFIFICVLVKTIYSFYMYNSVIIDDLSGVKHLSSIDIKPAYIGDPKDVLYTKTDRGKTIKLNIQESGILYLDESVPNDVVQPSTILYNEKKEVINDWNDNYYEEIKSPRTYYLKISDKNIETVIRYQLYKNNEPNFEGNPIVTQSGKNINDYKEFEVEEKCNYLIQLWYVNNEKDSIFLEVQKYKNGEWEKIQNKILTYKEFEYNKEIKLNPGKYRIVTKTKKGVYYAIGIREFS